MCHASELLPKKEDHKMNIFNYQSSHNLMPGKNQMPEERKR